MKKIAILLVFLMMGFASFAHSSKVKSHKKSDIAIKAKSQLNVLKVVEYQEDPISFGAFVLSCGQVVIVHANYAVVMTPEQFEIFYNALDMVYC